MDVPVQQFTTKAEQDLLDLFEHAADALPGDAAIAAARKGAIQTYAGLGLPHRRVEEWKYTDLRGALDSVPPLLAEADVAVSDADLEMAIGKAFMTLPAYRLVVAAGEFRADLSDVEGLRKAGVEIAPLAQMLESPPSWLKASLEEAGGRRDDVVIALNTALMTAGVAVRLPDGLTLQKPIHLIHLDAPGKAGSIYTRNVVVAEEGASATLIESFGTFGVAGLQRNAVTTVSLAAKSAIHHLKLQREALETIHLNVWAATIGAEARYNAFQVSMGAALARNQVYVRFDGENATTDISGATLARGTQHCDTTLVVEHNVPACESRELFKLVLNDEARGVFQGKIIVAKDAQKTDGKQMSQALLLSETAEFDSKPELEIFADDVVCGHGATSGQIDEELLFYLRARGLPEAQARALLIQAFVGEAFEALDDEVIGEAFTAVAAEWLGTPAQ
ncbi:Fe-S cluster assembly protein SufD [Methyloceanibacter caenitepidi]|uniref:Iron-sulfur cluster assembly protein SufD n=1 Tax=Methyloceanibacter caenitepidi TaxID=1384459 RepID=A0A0A8K2M4_9HYPH|nr:Fe-S cluster assembly protein SufD [Methyloceanibacter caenitepidi]BAQ17208.1 iron-sulfur cluster assembly protein SufD [Methyloceanibacter caenitepidi]